MALGSDFARVLVAAQRGDDHATEVLYRDLAPLIIGYLRANGAREPEDLASEVFVAMIRGINRFSGEETNFRSWLLTIAHRRLMDEFRRRGRRPEEPLEPGQLRDRAVPSAASPESDALDRLAEAGMLDALAALTPDQRAVITLRVLADLPIKEVAKILDKPVTAVKSLQHRALAALGRALGPATQFADGGVGTIPGSDH